MGTTLKKKQNKTVHHGWHGKEKSFPIGKRVSWQRQELLSRRETARAKSAAVRVQRSQEKKTRLCETVDATDQRRRAATRHRLLAPRARPHVRQRAAQSSLAGHTRSNRAGIVRSACQSCSRRAASQMELVAHARLHFGFVKNKKTKTTINNKNTILKLFE